MPGGRESALSCVRLWHNHFCRQEAGREGENTEHLPGATQGRRGFPWGRQVGHKFGPSEIPEQTAGDRWPHPHQDFSSHRTLCWPSGNDTDRWHEARGARCPHCPRDRPGARPLHTALDQQEMCDRHILATRTFGMTIGKYSKQTSSENTARFINKHGRGEAREKPLTQETPSPPPSVDKWLLQP